MYQKKFKIGVKIKTAEHAIKLIMKKAVIFHHHKPQTFGWTQNWSIISIKRYVSNNELYTARRNK